ncbi:MAG: hypothetical protein JWR40_3000 [Massilia sp.]|jgi:hypothetical protein|nr:hypothetical protein [Massilia sp.]MDB5951019.1 hypothetical protein [Massilia sp.]
MQEGTTATAELEQQEDYAIAGLGALLFRWKQEHNSILPAIGLLSELMQALNETAKEAYEMEGTDVEKLARVRSAVCKRIVDEMGANEDPDSPE